MSDWKVGDRVRVKPELADGYILPMREWVKNGRLATVISLPSWGEIFIQFDTARPPKRQGDYRYGFAAKNLEAAT